MPKQHVRMGPWARGLNTRHADTAIPQDSFVDCDNFELDAKGALRIRRGFRLVDKTLDLVDVKYYNIIYMQRIPYAVYSGTPRGGTAVNLYLVSCDALNVTTVTKLTYDFVGNTIASVIYYNSVIWVICSAGNSYYSNSMATPVSGIAFTAFSTGPNIDGDNPTGKLLGSSAVVLKDRLFIISSQRDSTVFYSASLNFLDWEMTAGHGGYFTVGAGDGLQLNQLVIIYDNILIFKTLLTYMLSYDSDPNLDGSVTAVSRQNGATHAQFIGSNLYVISPVSVYLFLNNIFYDVATDVELDLDINSRLVAMDDMLLVATASGIYAMNIHTRSWSIFSKAHEYFMYQQPRNSWSYTYGGTTDTFKVPVTNKDTGMQYIEWQYGGTFTDQEPTKEDYYYPEVTLRNSDFGDPSVYKRIYYCTLEGAYEGPDNTWRIRIFDTVNDRLYETQAFPRIDITTKSKYPLDRTRVCQPQLVIEPIVPTTPSSSVTYLGGILTSFGLVAESKDVQSGTED